MNLGIAVQVMLISTVKGLLGVKVVRRLMKLCEFLTALLSTAVSRKTTENGPQNQPLLLMWLSPELSQVGEPPEASA